MKKATLLLIAALLAFSFAAAADEPIIEREIHLKIVSDGGQVVDLEDLGDMEPGDLQTVYTDDGTPVTVERSETSFVITVEGEDPVTVDMAAHGAMIEIDCDGDDCDHNVIIKKFMGGEGAHGMFIGDDGTEMQLHADSEHVWVSDDSEGGATKRIKIIGDHGGHGGHGGPMARLIASGVLDDLTPEKRAAILDALAGPHEGHERRIKIKTRHSDDEEN